MVVVPVRTAGERAEAAAAARELLSAVSTDLRSVYPEISLPGARCRNLAPTGIAFERVVQRIRDASERVPDGVGSAAFRVEKFPQIGGRPDQIGAARSSLGALAYGASTCAT